MTKKQLFDTTLEYLEENCPKQYTELFYESPFQLLVAVVLSAQCTDDRVNMVTPKLFELYPTAALMSQATPDDIFPYISSVSYPNSKAKYLVGLSQKIMTHFHGDVPSTLDDLTSLELTAHIAQQKIRLAHFWLLYHGRYVCTARSPHCSQCGLSGKCNYFKKANKQSPDKSKLLKGKS